MPRDKYGKVVKEYSHEEKREGKESASKEKEKMHEYMKDMDIHHLKRKEEPRDEVKIGPHDFEYPGGMQMHFGKEEMERMKMNELPEVGHEAHFMGKGKFVSRSDHETADGEPGHHLVLQVTHMGIHHKPDDMHSEDQGGKEGKLEIAGRDKVNYGRKRN